MYKTDKARVSVFGMKTKFGGGVSQGFGLVYDDEESQKKFEPRHRLVRVSGCGCLDLKNTGESRDIEKDGEWLYKPSSSKWTSLDEHHCR